jgi:hypothetical protein
MALKEFHGFSTHVTCLFHVIRFDLMAISLIINKVTFTLERMKAYLRTQAIIIIVY